MRKTILLGTLAAFICGSLPVWAQSVFIVDRLTDTGEGEGSMGDLRYCITNALDGDSITFEVTGTINLSSPLPNLTRSISIVGPGADLLSIQGGGRYQIFFVGFRTTVSISGLTIANGWSGYDGGAIYNGGTLSIISSTIARNQTAHQGGAIYNDGFGILTIDRSTLSNNVAFGDEESNGYGGGINNNGTLTIRNCTLSNNIAESIGGGILNTRTLTIISSTIAGNRATARGGGISAEAGMVTIVNSTIAGNSLSPVELGTVGGGIFVFMGTLAITSSTITANQSLHGAGGGIGGNGTISLRNTILAGNLADHGEDLFTALAASGHNLIGNTNGGSGFDKTDLLNVDPVLGPLQDNGGPTFTQALLPGSPAIDAGDNTDAPEFDQRGEGFPRIVNGIIDIGSFEVQKAP